MTYSWKEKTTEGYDVCREAQSRKLTFSHGKNKLHICSSPCFLKDPGNEMGRLQPVLIVMQVSSGPTLA